MMSMAGIYIHIPFCKKKCSYCDFYSNANLGISTAMINSEIAEMQLRKDYLKDEIISSIYFGGGTPSVLSLEQVNVLMNSIFLFFMVLDDCEITFECNPDDLSIAYLEGLRKLGINRISVGVQSFDDSILKFLNRRHNSSQVRDVIKLAKETGFKNISIDLMYGIPGMSFDCYKESLLEGINSGVQHISAYHLNIEKNTLLHKLLDNNKIEELNEEDSIQQFDYTIEKLEEHGFRQYEVSNYSREGYMSKHNWLYWSNISYLGIGPSAHSYDGETRQWNISDNHDYMKGMQLKEGYFRIERLTEIDKYNEYILTALRTSHGVSLDYVFCTFNKDIYVHFRKIINELGDGDFMNFSNRTYALNKKGFFILDFLIRKFYY